MVRFLSILVVLTGVAGLAGCSPPPPPVNQAPLVEQAFEGFRDEIGLGRAQEALDYLDQPTRDYLDGVVSKPPSSSEPEVSRLIRGAAEKIAPGSTGPDASIAKPLQALMSQGILGPRDLAALTLGPVFIDSTGRKAHAEVLWLGSPTTLQVLFYLNEAGVWKIDLLNLLPYATKALATDQTLKRETEDQEIERLLRAVPGPPPAAATGAAH
jgi:hypothetical protein